ncbi:2-dehydro-3-deoxyphosphooctonate aldolase [Nitrospira tepida]|uniref:2-dehydro-3-deoxyphosphooctonate aldolase n=1 Tax=Nitrospira tepida TaxID=2973512 RepID=A0AA86N0N8_9BACT|nr:3-deoxy-8-phosphooctulonate synthase [Nitrospira tepida]CAI4032499.1 2-dehydro-3-deoxyphosphooctonate aldolase [Nitrospira tepida]
MHVVEIGAIKVGGAHRHVLIAGPCVIESETLALETAHRIAEIAQAVGMPYIFKSSYDKANRSSITSFRGLGIQEGLGILRKVKERVGAPLLTDVHSVEEARTAGEVVDVLQIPAFLCRQTDLLVAAAKTGRVVNVKKGQFLSPWDMANVVKKLEESGTRRILLTERGATFGYNNLVVDMRALPVMRGLGYPVIFDATHSVQLPGGGGTTSSGQREFIAPLASAAAGAGCDGFFMEVHPRPDEALSDGPNMVPLSELKRLLERVKRLCDASGKGPEFVL